MFTQIKLDQEAVKYIDQIRDIIEVVGKADVLSHHILKQVDRACREDHKKMIAEGVTRDDLLISCTSFHITEMLAEIKDEVENPTDLSKIDPDILDNLFDKFNEHKKGT